MKAFDEAAHGGIELRGSDGDFGGFRSVAMTFGVHLVEVQDEKTGPFVWRTFEPTERGVHLLSCVNVRIVSFPLRRAHAAHRRADTRPEPCVGDSALFHGGHP